MDLVKFYETLEKNKYTRKTLFGIGRYVFDSESDIIRGTNNKILAVSPSNKYPTLEQNMWFDDKTNALKLLEEVKENITSNFKHTKIYEHILYQNPNQDVNHLICLIDTFATSIHIYQGFCFMTSYVYIKKEVMK